MQTCRWCPGWQSWLLLQISEPSTKRWRHQPVYWPLGDTSLGPWGGRDTNWKLDCHNVLGCLMPDSQLCPSYNSPALLSVSSFSPGPRYCNNFRRSPRNWPRIQFTNKKANLHDFYITILRVPAAPPQQCKQNSFGFEPEFWAGQWTNKIHFYYYLNIMLTRKHDCLFKDLIVPFMILKFRRPSLNVPLYSFSGRTFSIRNPES